MNSLGPLKRIGSRVQSPTSSTCKCRPKVDVMLLPPNADSYSTRYSRGKSLTSLPRSNFIPPCRYLKLCPHSRRSCISNQTRALGDCKCTPNFAVMLLPSITSSHSGVFLWRQDPHQTHSFASSCTLPRARKPILILSSRRSFPLCCKCSVLPVPD